MIERPGHVASALELEAARAAGASLAARDGAAAVADPGAAQGDVTHAPVPGAANAAAATAATAAVAVAVQAAAPQAQERPQARGQISMPPPVRPPSPAQATPPAAPITTRGWRSVRSGLHRLSIGAHSCTSAALDLIGPAADRCDLVLGIDQAGQPIAIPIGPGAGGAARIAMVSGYWMAHLTACRALAAGAWVVVVTNNPAAWQALVERLPGDVSRLRLVPHTPPVPIPDDLPVPALVIHDGVLADSPPLSSAVASVELIPLLDAEAAVTLGRFDLVTVQCLDAREAGLAVSALALPRDSIAWLQELGPDSVAVLRGGVVEQGRLPLSDGELAWLGPAQR
jgi:hypothetical protein